MDRKIVIPFAPSTEHARNPPYFLWYIHPCHKCGAQYHQEYAPEGNEPPPGWWINVDTGDEKCDGCLNAEWDEAFGEETTDER